MHITTGKSRWDTDWKVRDVSWKAICGKLSKPIRTQETLSDYQKMSKDDKSKVKDVGGFVGGEIKDGRRVKSNVVSRSMVTLDADFAEPNIWERVSSLLDYSICCYSTHSHTQEAPRLRFVVPLDREVSPEEYEPIARQVASDIGIEQFDITTYEASRLMYWPSVSSDGEYFFKVSSGPMLSADEMLDRYCDWHDTTEWPISSQETVIRDKQAKAQGEPTEKPGMIGMFCRAFDIHSAIAEFLPDVYEPCGERYTYCQGSTSGGAVVYQDGKFLYSHHGTDPACGVLCNAFDLVRIHKFGDLDKNITYGTPINKYPSFKAMVDFIRNDPRCKEDIVAQNFTEAQDVFSEPLPEEQDMSWAEELSVTKQGVIESTINNVFVILENDARLKNKIAMNLFTNRLCIMDDLPWKECTDRVNGTTWDDIDDSNLRRYIEKVYGITGKDKVADALNVSMLKHSFHPVRDYLSGIKWDGEERGERLFIKYLGAEDSKYTRAVTKKWLTAAVTRVMNPGCKFDNMIVLVGAQGIGKSYLGKLLGGEWYSDTFSTLSGKEAYEQLKGAWILEMGELSVMKKAEVESVKMFISKQEDNYRSAYSRHVQSNKRQCVFYGTTNDDSFLHDRTGNRRFWPIGCDPEQAEQDIFSLTKDDIAQIWAEAVTWFKKKEPLYLDKDTAILASAEQNKYTMVDPRVGAVEEFLDTPIPENWKDLSKSDRRNYIQGFMKYEGELVQRDSISVAELAYELYGEEVLQPWQAKEYHNILIGIEGWAKTGKKVRSVYGQQYVYERKGSKDANT